MIPYFADKVKFYCPKFLSVKLKFCIFFYIKILICLKSFYNVTMKGFFFHFLLPEQLRGQKGWLKSNGNVLFALILEKEKVYSRNTKKIRSIILDVLETTRLY